MFVLHPMAVADRVAHCLRSNHLMVPPSAYRPVLCGFGFITTGL